MKIYEWELKNGISRTKEFERKDLATHAVNCGLKCGHGCKYLLDRCNATNPQSF